MIKEAEYFLDFDAFYASHSQTQETILLLVAEKTFFNLVGMGEMKSEVYGAIFPQVLYKAKNYETGIVALILQSDNKVLLVPKMSEPSFEEIDTQTKSLMVFFDGLSSDINIFLEDLFIYTDESLRIIGGGAGKMSFKQEPVIFDKKQMYNNAALVISSRHEMGIGVNHGWENMEGPFIATSTDGNLLKQINYENAFDFYVKHLNKEVTITQENFFDISKGHPFGIETFANETIVRDPIGFNEKGIQLVGPIAENAVISLLRGSKDGLISAACKASQQAIYHIRYIPDNLFVIDCISRALFLEEDFAKELEAIHSYAPDSNMFGALTLGEVANSSERYIEFFNKTCVIGAI